MNCKICLNDCVVSRKTLIKRTDHEILFNLIPEKATVLDLGCGDGKLLEQLKNKHITAQGIEIDSQLVRSCIKKGISVIQQDLDNGLADFQDNSFDFVILNKTLQATYKPLLVLKEAVRVGNHVLVSFPNFGYYQIRLQLFFSGSMPKSKDLPYEWYDTPNIHLVTIADFERFCKNNNFKIEKKIFYHEGGLIQFPVWVNLFSPYALFVLSRQSN